MPGKGGDGLLTNTKSAAGERCLVIGGAGMLGCEIASQLALQNTTVRVLDIQPLHDRRFDVITGDIRDRGTVLRACKGMDVVFQTAAAVWDPRLPERVYDEVNVEGNKNVVGACKALGVKKLVFTSTMDVVVDGRKPIVYGDESLPYPQKTPKDPYSRTKIAAEKMVLEANGPALAACVLRPAGMYGPRDKYHVPNIIKVAKSAMNVRLGDGSALFSHVYSENAAHAHVCAARHLYPGSKVAGQCYFITDHEPAQNLFDFMDPFIRELGLPCAKVSIPYRLAYVLALVSELVAPRSNFNRFAVVQTCVHHTFSSKKATRDFGYEPIVSKEEAFQRTVSWLKSAKH
jgi:sterol-4alpha-carboxylate 3-dehydrogenase (decarboxylating)